MKKLICILGLLFLFNAKLIFAESVVSDTIYTDSIIINPYTQSATKSLTGVKQIRIKATTGIDVRIAFGTGGNTTGTYRLVKAGSPFIMRNLNAVNISILALGNDATSSDTGVVSVVYTK